ncbi:MAG: sigma-70 family RNA polymerase sigma factor [Chromatiales bacterium]|nr:sigma-70 family RNA polymerase sigma factor [Chromatiales bacterium]
MEGGLLNNEQQPTSESFTDIDLTKLRTEMLRFATLQLRDSTSAEDAVQEALSAAFVAKDKFEGRAKVRSWVFSILRNKIIDIIRERARHPSQSLTQEDGSEDELNELFDENGRWRKDVQPSSWGQPEETYSNDQFMKIFEICLKTMKEKVARVFMMREFLGLETSDICTELNISESNCWVILHRGRSRLRLCLENGWINNEEIT